MRFPTTKLSALIFGLTVSTVFAKTVSAEQPKSHTVSREAMHRANIQKNVTPSQASTAPAIDPAAAEQFLNNVFAETRQAEGMLSVHVFSNCTLTGTNEFPPQEEGGGVFVSGPGSVDNRTWYHSTLKFVTQVDLKSLSPRITQRNGTLVVVRTDMKHIDTIEMYVYDNGKPTFSKMGRSSLSYALSVQPESLRVRVAHALRDLIISCGGTEQGKY